MPDALRERALRALARREYTRQELASKLAPLAEGAEQLDALLDHLTATGLLSDQRYANARLNSRARRFGDARLARELRAKGVSEELVNTALAVAEDELTRAQRVWQRRFGSQQTAAGNPVERARQMRFLAARGFSGETIRCVLRATLEDD